MENICLIVNDDPAIRDDLRAILRVERFQCLEASGASQALQLVRKLNGRIDMLLIDIGRPGPMNGIDLADSVRELYPNLPVILISDDGVVEAAERTSGFELIQKPFVADAILAAVRQLVRAPSNSAQTAE